MSTREFATTTTRRITISAGNVRNKTLPIGAILDLLPPDAVGGSKAKAASKSPIVLHVHGLLAPVTTDIPSDAATGRPRGMFRGRKWVGGFYKDHGLVAGDVVIVEKVASRTFALRPAKSVIVEPTQHMLPFNGNGRRKLPEPPARPYTFIDLFAGIGGFRIGMERAGMRCLFSSEWDVHSQKTYEAWFGERPHGDITKIDPAEIPDHDVLVGGFPCQPFSIAGVTKKNALGRAHGFLDKTQGTLFFNIAKIIDTKRPAAFVLENVKNLCSHDKGKTWHVIQSTLKALGYSLHTRILDAAGWVPQHRERIFIVGFDRARFGAHAEFEFPEPPTGERARFRDILDPNPPTKYTLTDHLWEYLQNYAKKHAAKGNGFGFGLTDLDGVSRTISARYYKDGAEVLIPQRRGKNPRRLTPQEARRLMGFPDDLPIVVSDTQAYRQFGNAVVPKVVHAVAAELVRTLNASVLARKPSNPARRALNGAI